MLSKFLSICGPVLCAAALSTAASAEVQVQWLGHSTTRIVTADDKVIVIDPFLTRNPMAPMEYRDPEALGPVDLILVTHGHPDHIGDLAPLARLTGAMVIGPYEALRNYIALGEIDASQVRLLNKGGYAEPIGRGLRVHAVPAEHSSSVDLAISDPEGKVSEPLRHVAGGEAMGFVIEFPDGFTIYHTGDTGLFGDMALIGELFEPDLVLICIGGTFTMGPEHAALALTRYLKPDIAMPIHYGTYPVINRTPEELIEALGDSSIEVLVFEPGETRKLP
jgi:L-ascorbate metabolism protein UlaG (beta-lactamase superfamily)